MGKGKECRLQLHSLAGYLGARVLLGPVFSYALQKNTTSSLHTMILLPSCAAGQTKGSTSPPRPGS